MTPAITLLVITDGRRACLSRTLSSFAQYTDADHIATRVIVNDCPEDLSFDDHLESLDFDVHVRPEPGRRGFSGSINAGWRTVNALEHPTAFVFHLEDDFLFTRHVDLVAMAQTVADRHLAQMALVRQPWNDAEALAGGVIHTNPYAYVDRSDGDHHWLEHRQFFTTNPSIYARSLTYAGWPEGPESEGNFGMRLFRNPYARCGYWGKRTDDPWVIHLGSTRLGTGY